MKNPSKKKIDYLLDNLNKSFKPGSYHLCLEIYNRLFLGDKYIFPEQTTFMANLTIKDETTLLNLVETYFTCNNFIVRKCEDGLPYFCMTEDDFYIDPFQFYIENVVLIEGHIPEKMCKYGRFTMEYSGIISFLKTSLVLLCTKLFYGK